MCAYQLSDILDANIEEDSSSGNEDGSSVGSLLASVQSECNQTVDRPIGAVFKPFTPEITATVWYNNNVSKYVYISESRETLYVGMAPTCP